MKRRADSPIVEIGDGMDSVTPLAGLVSLTAPMPMQDGKNDLATLRMAFPFLQILPVPFEMVGVVLAAGIAQDINVPDGAMLGRFVGSGDYFVSSLGTAVVPITADQGLTGNDAARNNVPNHSLYKPEYTWFYLGGKKQFSVISAGIVTVQLHCFSPRSW